MYTDNGWYAPAGTWSSANGYLTDTSAATSTIQLAQTSGKVAASVSYWRDNSGLGYRAYVVPRLNTSTDNRLEIMIYDSYMHLRENVGGSYVDLDDNQDADTALNTWYDLYVECDGSNVNVWRGERGQAKTLVLSTASATDITMGTSGRFQLFVSDNATYSFDDVRIESAGRRAYTAMYYDAGNRITGSARSGPAPVEWTDYYYDAWGRLTQRMIDGSTTNYAWRYDHKLYSVTSNIPGEGSATYSYGGDGKRRSRTAGGVTTKYKWGRGWDVVNEEDGNGTLQKTYIGHMAEVPGTNPATGAYAYYATDLIRSTRGLFDANKAQVASYEFTPYGDLFASSGTVSTTHLYTGHDWDDATNLYFAPYRYFSPDVARWMSPDPAGDVDGFNRSAYVHSNPVALQDRLGLYYCDCSYSKCMGIVTEEYAECMADVATFAGRAAAMAKSDYEWNMWFLGMAQAWLLPWCQRIGASQFRGQMSLWGVIIQDHGSVGCDFLVRHVISSQQDLAYASYLAELAAIAATAGALAAGCLRRKLRDTYMCGGCLQP